MSDDATVVTFPGIIPDSPTGGMEVGTAVEQFLDTLPSANTNKAKKLLVGGSA
ncbi:hypothetical protein ACQP1W_30500 [Spirillospora sp. CA-255316]